ncbi:3c6a7ae2-09cd-4234-82f6-0fc1d7bb4098 [Thermothielavioides terrestris]|uniref:3c6a7ae2-09cd-4234-82f6-0fc1d7bb4098 n=1 Tax=Thermothielavioides terrestris TaxID=2587410 RepID=A0A3S4D1T1_9PEZI|nr:3c6a7ae2-09cd-4234-82f6-0fc1d7bb4098 [Thermothielavioides terrestris]
MTARWILSPGVPIIDIKVDDQYNLRRKALGRVWAVALNALGEVYCLTEVPSPRVRKGKAEAMVKDAWDAGRTAYWELIEPTRRSARPDELDKNAVAGTYSPRSSANAMNLSRDQVAAEAREIEQFFRHTPAHFRKACEGWDMLRRLEVDFAAGGETGGGEAIFVITCGNEEGQHASVRRFVKGANPTVKSSPSGALTPVAQPLAARASIFGGTGPLEVSPSTLHIGSNGNGESPRASGMSTPRLDSIMEKDYEDEWRCSELVFKHNSSTEITATAVDMSMFAVMAAFEDPLLSGSEAGGASSPATPTSKHATGEIPGRRARLLAIGTNTGSVVVWNMRDTAHPVVHPLRVIQTESPEITSLAVSALYVVHGGSDSLVQAWDPLASSLEPIRTLNAKSSGRIPRHILQANPALQHANYFAVRAIALDPDPAVLRGVLAYGTFVRFWSYSSADQPPGRKRRLRHSDIHGRLASRRHNGAVSSYIAAEEAELRLEEEHRARELDRLRRRFGVDVGAGGVAGLTEDEALQYAQMISQETFLLEEQRRLSAGETTASSEEGATTTTETASSATGNTVTPEPSLAGNSTYVIAGGPSRGGLAVLGEDEVPRVDGGDDEFEAQLQRAIRLSLLESDGSNGQPPPSGVGGGSTGTASSCEYEYEFQTKPTKGRRKGKGKKGLAASASASPGGSGSSGSALPGAAGHGAADVAGGEVGVDAEDDLALALRLSLEEEEARLRRVREREAAAGADADADEYPPLEGNGKGKGRLV